MERTKLYAWIRKSGLTQRALADAAGISFSSVQKASRGEQVGRVVASAISRVTGIPAYEMLLPQSPKPRRRGVEKASERRSISKGVISQQGTHS